MEVSEVTKEDATRAAELRYYLDEAGFECKGREMRKFARAAEWLDEVTRKMATDLKSPPKKPETEPAPPEVAGALPAGISNVRITPGGATPAKRAPKTKKAAKKTARKKKAK